MPAIDHLLEPVSATAPCGEDLSFSAEFDAIIEARRADDATLDQGEWVTELKVADWPAVARRCAELLATRSKDLRLAVWLAEALVHQHGFAGFAQGFQLVAGLCERYWLDLHPQPDEGEDQELRIGNLGWLLGQSSGWLRAIPLTDAAAGRFDANRLEAAARGHAGDGADGDVPDAARIEAARLATPFAFYQRLAEDVPAARAALAALEAAVDARLGQDGPSFSAVCDTLESVGATALRFAAQAGVGSTPPAPSPAVPGPVAALAATAPATRADGELASRAEALQQLRRVAEFFRRTEPHSPVAYLADKAARWGAMPLHVWLRNVLKDNPALGELEGLLGVGEDAGGA